MEVKWLQGEELEVLQPIVEKRGWTPLHPAAVARVAFDSEGLVCGFHVLQLRPHPEPLWVREDMRGTGLAGDLAGDMHHFLEETLTAGFMCIADSPEAEKLCKSFGMKKVEKPVYVK